MAMTLRERWMTARLDPGGVEERYEWPSATKGFILVKVFITVVAIACLLLML